LTGKLKRNGTIDEGRIKNGGLTGAPPVADEYLYNVLDSLQQISDETGKSIPAIAINWLLHKNTVSNIIIGARNETQLLQNIDAVNWNLSKEQVDKLDIVSQVTPIYPHWVGER
jgi:aryl-alcohol dehydrogenase-like predicted oxidoreductase